VAPSVAFPETYRGRRAFIGLETDRGREPAIQKGQTMTWERPGFVEIAMNAEIGGYQSDFEDEGPTAPRGPVLGAEPAAGAPQANAAPAT
jgi:hypothetical protein